jgi:hypothetical protein
MTASGGEEGESRGECRKQRCRCAWDRDHSNPPNPAAPYQVGATQLTGHMGPMTARYTSPRSH